MYDNDIWLYAAKGDPSDSHPLLLRAAVDWCRRHGAEVCSFTLARTKSGKPYFKDAPQLHFSISHSGDWWLCAIGQQELGLDIQQVKTLDAAKLARRFFHPLECDHLQTHPEDFFRIWTAKESYVKFTGTGIAGAFRGFSVVENSKLREKINKVTLQHLPFKAGYVLCLCCQKPGELHWIEKF